MNSTVHKRSTPVVLPWEYWPAWLINIPVVAIWLIQGIRSGHPLFFTRVNPDINEGAFLSPDKWKIYQKFPRRFVPRGCLISSDLSFDDVCCAMEEDDLDFPVIVKPNIGERGRGVHVIRYQDQLKSWNEQADFPYIIQEFLTLPYEISILAHRHPASGKVRITSICTKEKLHIVGDGRSTVRELVHRTYRARRQWDRIKNRFNPEHILSKGKHLELVPIGNHCKGATFYDRKDLNTTELNTMVRQLFNCARANISYGRFDLMYSNYDDLLAGRNFFIIEFNGVAGEPAHVYQPGYSLVRAYRDYWRHARIMGDLSMAQKSQGIKSQSWNSFIQSIVLYRKNLKAVKRVHLDLSKRTPSQEDICSQVSQVT